MYDVTKVAKRIKYLRKTKKKVSQEQMAEALGMYQTDISRLENGKSCNMLNNVQRLSEISEYLGVPLQYLMFGSEDETLLSDSKEEGSHYEK